MSDFNLPRRGGGQQASASSNETHARAGFNAGIGYLLSRKVPLDIAVQFSYFNLAFVDSDSETKLLGVGFSVGYSMAL